MISLVCSGMGAVTANLLVTGGLGPGDRPPLAPLRVFAIYASENVVVLQFNDTIHLHDMAAIAANYSITLVGPGNEVTVQSVMAGGNRLALTTTPQTQNATYTLHLPIDGIEAADGTRYLGPWDLPFAGGAVGPAAIALIRVVNAFAIDVVFNRRVNPVDARNVANYSIAPPLDVVSATYVTDWVYRIGTSRQVDDLAYTLSISNIGGI